MAILLNLLKNLKLHGDNIPIALDNELLQHSGLIIACCVATSEHISRALIMHGRSHENVPWRAID